MKIKIRERDKITFWIIVGFFIIMMILTMLKPMWATVNASETVPATVPVTEVRPQVDRVVVDFIEVTRPTEPAEPTTEPIEHTESVEKVPVKDEVKIEVETQPQVEIESEPVEESEPEPESDPELRSLGRFKLTAYCACSKCCGKSDGVTASGTKAKQGRTIAVDPKQIPYGTKVVINGCTYVAEDCGGGIKQNRIDVFFNSHKDALNFGVQYAEVYIYVD